MLDSKMSTEIRAQPEVLDRILDEGWSEVLTASRVCREGSLRSVMFAARGTSDNAATARTQSGRSADQLRLSIAERRS